jgi:purine-nucleoside phosphorylase
MAEMGARQIIVTNAAGILNETLQPGGWLLVRDHINLTGTSPLLGEAAFVDMSEAYSGRLRAHWSQVARGQGTTLPEGVYAGVPGPQYETPAEIRMLQLLGADVVGMSTVLETIQARALGLEVVALSCLTNFAAGLRAHPLRHEDVLKASEHAIGALARLLRAAVA